MEEICGYRGPDDGGPKLLVRWEGGEETWEPYKNVGETEALDEYERLHGRIGADIVWDFVNLTAYARPRSPSLNMGDFLCSSAFVI